MTDRAVQQPTMRQARARARHWLLAALLLLAAGQIGPFIAIFY